jgi:hypothetical protein
MLFNNPLIKKLNFESIIHFFSFDNIVHYHPLVYLSYSIENSIFGLNPFYFHLDNIVLHCVNVVLVFFFVTSIGSKKYIALITAVLFAVHPLHVESVAWITERKDVLYSLFFMSSLICYIKYKKNDAKLFYLLSLILFVFSCLSKAMAVSLPLVLILVDFILSKQGKPETRINWRIKEKTPFVILSVLFSFINLNVSYYQVEIFIYSFYERISIIAYAALFYPLKIFLPINLSAIYSLPDKPQMEYLISPVILLVLAGILIKKRRKLPYQVKFGLLFYIVTVIPVLPFLPFGISIIADRFSYIPIIGFLYIISHMLYEMSKRHYFKNIRYVYIFPTSVILLVSVLMYLTYKRAECWKNTEVLMKDVLERDNGCYNAYLILGNYYLANNRCSDAINCYLKFINLKNNYADVYYNLGNAYFYSNDYENSIKSYLRVLTLNPYDKLTYNNLGVVYERMGMIDAAIENYKKSADLGYEPAENVLRFYNVMY